MSVTYPLGFRACGVQAGLRTKLAPDLAPAPESTA